MAELDYTTNPWPAIRELQGIVGNITSEIEELKERLQIMEDFVRKARYREGKE